MKQRSATRKSFAATTTSKAKTKGKRIAKAKRSKPIDILDIAFRVEGSLATKFRRQAEADSMSPDEQAYLMVNRGVPIYQEERLPRLHRGVRTLAKLIATLPSVQPSVGTSGPSEVRWWIKFSIARNHPLAWHVIQRLGWVLNYYSLDERFETTFHPISPPPDLNGGPEFLSWVIEATLPLSNPDSVTRALRDAIPKPVKSESLWRLYDTDDAE